MACTTCAGMVQASKADPEKGQRSPQRPVLLCSSVHQLETSSAAACGTRSGPKGSEAPESKLIFPRCCSYFSLKSRAARRCGAAAAAVRPPPRAQREERCGARRKSVFLVSLIRRFCLFDSFWGAEKGVLASWTLRLDRAKEDWVPLPLLVWFWDLLKGPRAGIWFWKAPGPLTREGSRGRATW